MSIDGMIGIYVPLALGNKITGKVVFDANDTGAQNPALPGISGAKVVLQNTGNSNGVVVITDSSGNFEIDNVLDGSYILVEDYTASGGTVSPVDYSITATNISTPQGNDPPISLITNPPATATRLNSLSPNYVQITISGKDSLNNIFVDAPIAEIPIDIGTSVAVPPNLLTVANAGDFGSVQAGSAVNTSPATSPYPTLAQGFVYQQYTTGKPPDGKYSLVNIALEAYGWWYVANHTTFDERGNLMFVNGANPGKSLYVDTVVVKPNTDYLFSSWVINMTKGKLGLALPQLGVVVRGDNGQIFFEKNLNNIPETDIPTWIQAGAVFNSGSATRITVEFLSQGPAAGGNDYALDDISLKEVKPSTPTVSSTKSNDKTKIVAGGLINYTTSFTTDIAVSDVIFQDTMPNGTTFVKDSVKVNGVPKLGVDPSVGFSLGALGDNSTITVQFEVKSTADPAISVIDNTGVFNYTYPKGSSAISTNTVRTLVEFVKMKITKYNNKRYADIGDNIIYTIVIQNTGDVPIENLIFKDTIPAETDFVTGSTTLNGVSTSDNPEITGVKINTINPKEAATITFTVKIKNYY